MIQTLVISYFISLLGSIPPGSINVTTMKLSVIGKLREAYFLALGATIVEFFYALLVVRFQMIMINQLSFSKYFTLITAAVLFILGIYSFFSKSSTSTIKPPKGGGRKGFAKGIVLGVLNPLAIPFWLAITSYLQGNGWIILDGPGSWVYLTGIVLGSLTTLYLAANLGSRFTRLSDNRWLVHILPGIVFLSMSGWNIYQWATS